MRRSLTAFFCVLLIGSAAQDSAMVMKQARTDLDILAGPEMYGRGYVAKGDSLAAEYLADRFKKIGAKPIDGNYFQPFEFPVNTFPHPLWVQLDSIRMLPGETYLLDPASASAKGSFAIEELDRTDLLNEVKRVLKDPCIECAYWVDPVSTKNRDSLLIYRSLKSDLTQVAPVLWVNNEKFTWGVSTDTYENPLIEVKHESSNTPKVAHLEINNEYIRRHRARNVMAMVPAKKKSKDYIVFTAHYDHLGMMGKKALFAGANDNASGTTMLLSLAEYYANDPADVNIVFIAFAGEEAGLLGSRYYADHPTIELDKIKFLLNLDIFGTGDEGITAVNATAHPKEFELLKEIGEKDGRLLKVKKRSPSYNSDHAPFVEKGVPAFFIYTMGGIKAYHDIYDRPETLPLTEYYDIYRTLIEFVERMD